MGEGVDRGTNFMINLNESYLTELGFELASSVFIIRCGSYRRGSY